MPDYLQLHAGKCFGLEPVAFFGIVAGVAGLLATLAGGMAGDLLQRRFPGSYFLVSGLGLWLTVPCILLFMAVPFNAAWIFIFLAVFFLFFNTGPTNAILANVTHPSIRASGFALNILVIHVLGDAVSPPIVGAIADYSSSRLGVRPGTPWTPAFWPCPAALGWRRDLAPRRPPFATRHRGRHEVRS